MFLLVSSILLPPFFLIILSSFLLPFFLGVMRWDNGIEYKGMWSSEAGGGYHGHGRKLYSRGGGYEGPWVHGKREGR